MTNYEKIKNMTVSELAEMLMGEVGCRYCINQDIMPCYKCDEAQEKSGIMQWLISEVEE